MTTGCVEVVVGGLVGVVAGALVDGVVAGTDAAELEPPTDGAVVGELGCVEVVLVET